MADLGKLTLGELHSAKTAAEFLLQMGTRHDVLEQGLADRLITFHWALAAQVKEHEDAGREGRHAAVAARRPDGAARH